MLSCNCHKICLNKFITKREEKKKETHKIKCKKKKEKTKQNKQTKQSKQQQKTTKQNKKNKTKKGLRN